MAWTAKGFENAAQAARDCANGVLYEETSGFKIAENLAQLGALLAERSTRPGRRLYEVKRGDRAGLVMALGKISTAWSAQQRGSGPGFVVCLELNDNEQQIVLGFQGREDADAERAELIAAWRGDG